jgi:hypothetical protein
MVISGGEQCIFIQQHKGMSVNIKFLLANQARSIHRLKHITQNAQPETNIEVVLTVNSVHLFNNTMAVVVGDHGPEPRLRLHCSH